MRGKMEELLKEELRTLALKTRDRQNLTQREMAEILSMNEISYSDIETGVYMCGTLTTVLLLMKQADPTEFFEQLRQRIKKLFDDEAAGI